MSEHATKAWRWQDHFAAWLATRPDMQRRGLTDQLEEYTRLHPQEATRPNK